MLARRGQCQRSPSPPSCGRPPRVCASCAPDGPVPLLPGSAYPMPLRSRAPRRPLPYRDRSGPGRRPGRLGLAGALCEGHDHLGAGPARRIDQNSGLPAALPAGTGRRDSTGFRRPKGLRHEGGGGPAVGAKPEDGPRFSFEERAPLQMSASSLRGVYRLCDDITERQLRTRPIAGRQLVATDSAGALAPTLPYRAKEGHPARDRRPQARERAGLPGLVRGFPAPLRGEFSEPARIIPALGGRGRPRDY